MDAIDELVARSKPHTELLRFHRFHQQHPEVLDFLVSEIQLRLAKGFGAFSYGSLWDYARWKLELDKGPGDTFKMNDHLCPFYGRAITILHPEFNGHCEFRVSREDGIFGTRIETSSLMRGTRRLQWEDGTALEDGWRPSQPHVATHAGNRKPDVHPR